MQECGKAEKMNIDLSKKDIEIIKQALNIAIYMGKDHKECSKYRNVLIKFEK